MRNKLSELNFKQSRTVRFFAVILLTLAFSAAISAQPGDCRDMGYKSVHCAKERVESLGKIAAEINIISAEILREPDNAGLYNRRGLIYASLFKEDGSSVVFENTTYFSETDARAIDDFNRAIEIAPRAEFYAGRGEVYQKRWDYELRTLYGMKINYLLPETAVPLEVIENGLTKNANFAQAEKDFQEAAGRTANFRASVPFLNRLAKIRRERAHSLGFQPHFYLAVVQNKMQWFVFKEFDWLGDYYRKLLDTRTAENREERTLSEVYFSKGNAAVNFGEYQAAVQAFDEAEKYISTNYLDFCNLYNNRGKIKVKLKDFDGAIKDYSFALNSAPYNCRYVFEHRADAFAAKGDFGRAAEDYTKRINQEDGKSFPQFFIKRGKTYLKLGEGEKAAADFSYAIERNSSCLTLLVLRAQAFRLAGKNDLADADETEVRMRLEDLPRRYRMETDCPTDF